MQVSVEGRQDPSGQILVFGKITMNSRDINIALTVVVIVLLALLAFRVSFEASPGSGGCCSMGGGCNAAAKNVPQGRLK